MAAAGEDFFILTFSLYHLNVYILFDGRRLNLFASVNSSLELTIHATFGV